MKKTIITCSLLMSCLISNGQNIIDTDHSISGVTVFLAGAEVSRTANTALKPGKNKVTFKGLSPFLDPASLQVTVDDDIKILSVTAELDYLVPEKLEPRIKTVKDSIDIMGSKIRGLNDILDAYRIEKEVMLSNKSIGGANVGVSVEELEKTVNFYRKRIIEINKKITELSQEVKHNQTRLNQLNSQLNVLNYENNPKRYDVSVLVESNSTKPGKMEVRYLCGQAGWEPIYDITSAGIGSPVNLHYKGRVFNNTSINWEDVKMNLSSADPYSSATQPKLQPWYLNYTSDVSTYRMQSTKVDNYNTAVQSRSADVWDNNQMKKVQYKQVLVSEVSVDFDIADPYSIPADAHPYMISISENELNATYSHFSAPKLEKKAFIIAEITGWENLSLIEGPSNIYFDNKFVGKSSVNPVEFTDTMRISMGRDDKVLVERIEKLDYTSKTIFGNHRKEKYQYEIKIKNQHSSPIKITVQDQYPISKNSEISVSVDEISEAEKDEETGIVEWRFDLAASETKSYQLSYTVKYPKNKKVVTKTRYKTSSAPMFK